MMLVAVMAAYGLPAEAALAAYRQYDLRRRATMRFDITPEVVDDPRSAERALWEGVR
jgi:hypothetical protein